MSNQNFVMYLLLNQVKECEHKYPNQIHKVPIKTYFLYHQVMAPSFIGSLQHIDQYHNVDNHPGRYVEPVKAGNGEEQVTEIHIVFGRNAAPPVPFVMKVGPFVCLTGQEQKPPEYSP